MASPPTSARADLLANTTQALCDAFARSASLEEIAPLFIPSPTITEHGPLTPSVPFLNTFSGPTALEKYMSILARLLKVSDASYGEPIVDVSHNSVCVKGRGKFTWIEGKGKDIQWSEEFVYVLSEFDESGKIGRWEVWADPLSAWLASQGRKLAE